MLTEFLYDRIQVIVQRYVASVYWLRIVLRIVRVAVRFAVAIVIRFLRQRIIWRQGTTDSYQTWQSFAE